MPAPDRIPEGQKTGFAETEQDSGRTEGRVYGDGTFKYEVMIKTTRINTPLGEMIAAATNEGICMLEFADCVKLSKELSELKKLLNSDIRQGRNIHLRHLKKQLKEYFAGRRTEFDLPLLTPGTEFQQAVWNELLKIPYGETISYRKQADALNNPLAVRAVAGANGSNRIGIIIPCHRVIGSDGSLVGYGGGVRRKKWLLDHEKKYSGQPVTMPLFQKSPYLL